MILPDVNLLVYAHDASTPEHSRARRWWTSALSGEEPIVIPWVVLLAFVRLSTHPQVCRNPVGVAEARGVVESWLRQPQVRVGQLSQEALPVFFDLLEASGQGGNLSTDACIATHAREYSATIYTNDRDFERFPGIKCVNPLR